MKLKTCIFIIVSAFISALIVWTMPTTKALEPQNAYRVYLKGETIGLIKNKEDLERYIDKEQENLKEKYDVDKVYAPEDLKIVKAITYSERILSTQEIYEKIKDIEPFTIKGYAITIKGLETTDETGAKKRSEDQNIYVLDKKIFDESMDQTIRSFINSESYDKYSENTQGEIKETGSLIENINIENKVIVKETNVPVNKTIYESTEELSKYLLFGTLDEHQTYTVQDGDTISDVAFNNKLSTKEFLIANPELPDENSLLFPGQQVTISIIKPQFRLVELEHVVSEQEVSYQTETRYDNTKMVGTQEVLQKGEKGLQRITSKVQKVNGQVESSVIDNSKTETLKEPVTEIIVRGGKQSSYGKDMMGNTVVEGYWAWPTRTPYVISSYYGYRWGVLHDGTDIAGAGYGSPIYAANNGIVVTSSYKYDNGQYIVINHNNGYYTLYAHLSARYVKEGQNVAIGQEIGAMGQSGFATGTHLHFSLWKGFPYRRGSQSYSALSLYR